MTTSETLLPTTTESSAKENMRSMTLLWGGSALLIASYPLAVSSFSHAVSTVLSTTTLATQLWLFTLTCMLFAPSVFGVYHLQKSSLGDPSQAAARALLHIVICTPVLYTATTLFSYIFGMSASAVTYWLGGAALLLAATTQIKPFDTPRRYPSWLRVTHGVLAALFVAGFAGMHLLNHTSALWSPTLHQQVQNSLQSWYLKVEPLLFSLCVLLVLSGIFMASYHIRSASHRFKRLQTATGSFLGLFLCVHVTAILYARDKGITTNWYYASGEQGLLFSFHFLIPYYTLALLCFSLHGALAARQIAIAHGISATKAQQLYFRLRIAGLLITLMIMTAALGFSITR